MTNYEKVSTLLSIGYASKLDKTGCLTFDLGYNTFGFIYPNDANVTVILDNSNINSDCGSIDINTMSIVGTKDNCFRLLLEIGSSNSKNKTVRSK